MTKWTKQKAWGLSREPYAAFEARNPVSSFSKDFFWGR